MPRRAEDGLPDTWIAPLSFSPHQIHDFEKAIIISLFQVEENWLEAYNNLLRERER